MSKLFSGLALVLAATLLPDTVHAQKAQNEQSTSRDRTYLDYQVEQAAKLKSGPSPVYPDHLRNAGIDGRVIVQFIVDERGRPDMASFKVVKSTDPALTESVRRAVAGMSFTPAEADGQKVKQLVQLPFNFTPVR